MTNTPVTNKIMREFDMVDPFGVRCDFYNQEGPIASVYCKTLTMIISAELVMRGYDIEDYPRANTGGSGETTIK